MKRIGILTYFTDFPYFNDINPGMNLQAYSLYLALKNQHYGAEIEFIRYHSWWAEWRPYFSGMTFSTLVQDFRQLVKYYRFTKQFPTSRKALVTKSRDKALGFIDSLSYDAIYVGSDTLLELFRSKSSDDITAYWLSSDVKAKKIMIAASARDTSFSKLSEIQKSKLFNSIQSFEMLGVRDNATYQLVKNFTYEDETRLKMIPDPTFALDIDYSYAHKYLDRKGVFISGKPIICFHFLKTNHFVHELSAELKKRGFLIASLRPSKYADFILKDLGPLEFAGIFKFFHITLTHRFHDSVFCLKNLSPLLLFLPSETFMNESRDSKQSSLMDSFSLRKECFIEDIEKEDLNSLMKRIIEVPILFEKKKPEIKEILKGYRHDFNQYVSETSQMI